MAYDEELAERIRELSADGPELTEKKMFGGLGFMLEGNMAVAASSTGGLMVRIDPDEAAGLTLVDGVELFEMKGRQMNGWVHVEGPELDADESLSKWLEIGLDFAAALPPK